MNTKNPRFSADFDHLVRHARHCSRYLSRLLDAEPELLSWLHENHLTPCDGEVMRVWSDALPAETEEQLSKALRALRKRVMLHVLTRDLNGLSDLGEVMRSMTALAEHAVRRAQTLTMQALIEQFGQPIGAESGAYQELLVIGMGKLGGGELNVSSDIDLIFVYEEDGATAGGGTATTLSNHEFFWRLGRRLNTLLSDTTEDGFVFRVDLRLRPNGTAGPLAVSMAMLEEYFVVQGRDWERYAWIKARVVSDPARPGVTRGTTALLERVSPFVYRRHLDYSAIGALRTLH